MRMTLWFTSQHTHCCISAFLCLTTLTVTHDVPVASHWDHHSTINLLPSLFTNQIMTLCISLTFGFVHWFCRSLLIENGGCLISSDDLCLSPLICLSPLHPGVCHEQDLPRLHANTHHQPVHFHPLHTQMENGWQGWGIKWYKENTVATWSKVRLHDCYVYANNMFIFAS